MCTPLTTRQYLIKIAVYYNIIQMGIFHLFQSLPNNIYFQFIIGTIGIYTSALVSSVYHQKVLKVPYYSHSNQILELFTYANGLLVFPYLSGWVIGSITTCFSSKEPVKIPAKNLLYCSVTIFIAVLSYNTAIVETSYPIVIMVRSCSILSVAIVGVFFSRVKDTQNKLGKNKLVVGILVTMGILVYNVFGDSHPQQRNITVLGGILLLISLIADGFLPDFQAQIKTVYQPGPTFLMTQINKWVFILAVIYSVAKMEFFPMMYFVYDHPSFGVDIVINSVTGTICQLFVYYLIQKFRQHIVPFIVTTRKIFSVVISILWFNHKIGPMQWMGIGTVFLAAIFDFMWEKYCTTHHEFDPIKPQEVQKVGMIMHQQTTVEEDSQVSDITLQDILAPQKPK